MNDSAVESNKARTYRCYFFANNGAHTIKYVTVSMSCFIILEQRISCICHGCYQMHRSQLIQVLIALLNYKIHELFDKQLNLVNLLAKNILRKVIDQD